MTALMITNVTRSLILLAHGARDPRWAEPLVRIRQLIAEAAPSLQVHQAFLELMSPSLPELAAQLVAQGVNDMVIVPLFLGQGAHVRTALPQLMQHLQATHPHIHFTLTATPGENEQVLRAIAAACLACL